jgi:hypothetical protein
MLHVASRISGIDSTPQRIPITGRKSGYQAHDTAPERVGVLNLTLIVIEDLTCAVYRHLKKTVKCRGRA